MYSSSYENYKTLCNRLEAGETLQTCYKEWAKTYDDDFCGLSGPGYDSVFPAVEKHFINQKDALILDVGAGTGYAGIQLHKRGFNNIDGVDASEDMLNVAKEKGIYRRMLCHFVGHSPLPIAEGTYDCVLEVGALGYNHLPVSSLIDMFRVLKRGGLLMLQADRNHWFGVPEYQTILDLMVDRNEAIQEEWSVLSDYGNYGNGPVEGLLLIYRKL